MRDAGDDEVVAAAAVAWRHCSGEVCLAAAAEDGDRAAAGAVADLVEAVVSVVEEGLAAGGILAAAAQEVAGEHSTGCS